MGLTLSSCLVSSMCGATSLSCWCLQGKRQKVSENEAQETLSCSKGAANLKESPSSCCFPAAQSRILAPHPSWGCCAASLGAAVLEGTRHTKAPGTSHHTHGAPIHPKLAPCSPWRAPVPARGSPLSHGARGAVAPPGQSSPSSRWLRAVPRGLQLARALQQGCTLPREYQLHQLFTLSPEQPRKVLGVLLFPRPAWETQHCSTARASPAQLFIPHCCCGQTGRSVLFSPWQVNLFFLS